MASNHSAEATQTRADGKAIRELRIDRDLSIPAAARLIGCHYKSLAKIELGGRDASERMLRRIARAYGVPAERIRVQEEDAA